MSQIEEANNDSDVNNTREAENVSDVKNTHLKIQIQILKILNKCPLETRVVFGDESQYTIKITILDETKHLVTKPTGGGRGSRERRRRRREQQRMQQQQSQQQHEQQQQLQQAEPAHDIYEQQRQLQQTELIETIIMVEELDIDPVPELAEYNHAAVEQNSSPTYQARILAPHSGPDQGQLLLQPRIPNISTGRTRPVAARQESNNNQQHLMQLLQEKMRDMDAKTNSMEEEKKDMIDNIEQLRCTVKRIREVKEKPVFCWHCMLYTNAIHFCINKRKWIHVDRINRIIIYADNENGATPRHANDANENLQVVCMQKFSIDNREEIIEDKKAEKAKREKHESEAQDTQELSWMMGKIFGEFQTYNICNELNKHLDEDHDSLFTWSDVNKFLGYHPNDDYPKLVEDSNILGGNSITICNTRSIQESTLPMDISQLDVVVDIEGDVELLLGLGPLLVGGVSCLLETENSSKNY